MVGYDEDRCEKEMEKLVEEFLQQDAVSSDVEQRVEQYRSDENIGHALELILEDCR